jgi:hypothetical protein
MSMREPSRGAIGWITFAGILMIIGGGFAILQGLGWLINSDQFQGKDAVFSGSATTWGWIQLIVGAIVFFAGFGVFTGNVLARTVGVFAACASALTTFVSIRFYPVWGIIVIAMDLAIIWALTAHGRDIQKEQEMMGGMGG